MMAARPATNNDLQPAKRFLYRVALIVAINGSILLSGILFVQGYSSLIHLRQFYDLAGPPIRLSSILLIAIGLISVIILVLLIVGFVQVHRISTLIASCLSIGCSFGLIAFTLWSVLSLKSTDLSDSMTQVITKELESTQHTFLPAHQVHVENSKTMALLEKQYQCCGLIDPIDDYRARNGNNGPTLSSTSTSVNVKPGRTTNNPKTATQSVPTVSLPISCCNEKFRTNENQCVDPSASNNNVTSRYNTVGCLGVILRSKVEHIKQQTVKTIIATCLSVINSISLAAVIRLLAQVYQIEPSPNSN